MVQCGAVCCSVLHYVAVCLSVLQCLSVCCSALQCVAVCCSAVIYIMIMIYNDGTQVGEVRGRGVCVR